MSKIDKIIDWFRDRKGKVTYSMEHREGTSSYDCSSSVFFAVCSALGIKDNDVRNTSNLGRFLVQHGFEKVTENAEWEAKKGDIVIWAKRKGVPGASAHTGVFTDNNHIIHCNYNANGISENTENSLSYLYKWNYEVYRFKEDEREEKKQEEFMEQIQERYMINGNYSIDSLPWFCSDRKNVGNTKDYQGYVVTVSRKWGSYWYSQYLGGWIDYRAFEEVETISEEKTVKNKGYSVDTKPWGTAGFETKGKSDDLIGNTFKITARKGAYLYIHSKAKWVDEKAFE